MRRGSAPLDLSDGERWALGVITAQEGVSGAVTPRTNQESNDSGRGVTETQEEEAELQ